MKGSNFTLFEVYVIDVVCDSYFGIQTRPSLGYDISFGPLLAKVSESKNNNLCYDIGSQDR